MAPDIPPDDILLQVTPRLPLEDVWTALVRPDHLEKWLAPKVHVEYKEGGAYELFWDNDEPPKNSTKGCKVLRYREPEVIVFSWKGPPRFDKLMNHGKTLTHVQLTVNPCPEGIDVTLEHKGWGAGDEWEAARSWHFHYWDDILHRFKDYVMTDAIDGPPKRE